ncbi:MAG TPA: hypothetical protein VF070_46775 [Streptosporangiaceae bacterium]
MGETRLCDQCGKEFELRREHARFCSSDCRIGWVREHSGDPGAPGEALSWSITAMTEATTRLVHAATQDLHRFAAAVSEAVWWVTIVDATMVRYEREAYDWVLERLPAEVAERVDETLAGLRYVRNQVGINLDPAEFVRPAEDGTWIWSPLSEPCLESLSPRGQGWEMGRYLAYRSRLVGHDVAGTFAFASSFLTRIAAQAPAA